MKTIFAVLLALTAICVAQGPKHDAVQVTRWCSATVDIRRAHEVQVICNRIERDLKRYQSVAKTTGVPAVVIAGLHAMEADGNFNLHLHEGSPLKFRTRYVPKGRPLPPSQPPFKWEFSAADALAYDHMQEKNWSSLGASLSACEGYNGWGTAKYHPETPTPYLYAATSEERPGKYIKDGVWSSTARSSQIGIVAIWKELARRNLVILPSR